MKAPSIKPTVKLIGQDGNAFAVMGSIKQALKNAGADKEYIDQYIWMLIDCENGISGGPNTSLEGDYVLEV